MRSNRRTRAGAGGLRLAAPPERGLHRAPKEIEQRSTSPSASRGHDVGLLEGSKGAVGIAVRLPAPPIAEQRQRFVASRRRVPRRSAPRRRLQRRSRPAAGTPPLDPPELAASSAAAAAREVAGSVVAVAAVAGASVAASRLPTVATGSLGEAPSASTGARRSGRRRQPQRHAPGRCSAGTAADRCRRAPSRRCRRQCQGRDGRRVRAPDDTSGPGWKEDCTVPSSPMTSTMRHRQRVHARSVGRRRASRPDQRGPAGSAPRSPARRPHRRRRRDDRRARWVPTTRARWVRRADHGETTRGVVDAEHAAADAVGELSERAGGCRRPA